MADGFEVLQIPKGLWVEAIFAKAKPEAIKLKSTYGESTDFNDDEEDNDDDVEIKDDYYKNDPDDEDPDDDKLTEESYRTTYEENPEELNLEASEIGDDDDF